MILWGFRFGIRQALSLGRYFMIANGVFPEVTRLGILQALWEDLNWLQEFQV
jgi:hypothetical protein